jgi:hypothetical protein
MPYLPTLDRLGHRPVTIDLVALRQLEGPAAVLLDRYLRAIEVERGDYKGRVLTIRRSDATALASILDCPPHQIPARLDHMGLRSPTDTTAFARMHTGMARSRPSPPAEQVLLATNSPARL